MGVGLARLGQVHATVFSRQLWSVVWALLARDLFCRHLLILEPDVYREVSLSHPTIALLPGHHSARQAHSSKYMHFKCLGRSSAFRLQRCVRRPLGLRFFQRLLVLL